MKKVVLSLVSLMWAVALWAVSPLGFSGSDAAMMGVCVVDLSTGKYVVSHNAEKVFIPASVMKCVTAAAAVEAIDASRSPFVTNVKACGHIKDNILHGNIMVIGSGDPTLDSRHLGGTSRFVDAVTGWVARNGIDSITGDVVVVPDIYPSMGVSPYWLLEDIAWEYGAGLYGFNWHDNSFSMRLTEEGVESMSPEIDGLDVVNNVRRGTRGSIMAMRGEDSYSLYVYGTMTAGSYSSRYSMPCPHIVFRDELVNALAMKGIGCGEVEIAVDEDAVAPMTWPSPSRDEILRVMMLKSDNLYAEGMLRALTLGEEDHSVERAIAIEENSLEAIGLDFSHIKIADGSGLAVTNRVSPRFLARLLALMRDGRNGDAYAELFPRVGKEGTVKSLLAKTRLAGRLALKSGSMSGVLCYAGYKLDASGRPTHAVVIMVNGFMCRGTEVRKSIEEYLLKIF